MKIKPITIWVNDQSYEIGHTEPWGDDPTVFDGWLAESSSPVDELVVNGASEAWARYRVLARYLETLIAEINATNGQRQPVDLITLDEASMRLASTAEAMEDALREHSTQND